MTFYGALFITDPTGEIIKQMDRETEGVIVVELDLDEIRDKRRSWGIYRYCRPEMYGILMTLGTGN